MIEIYLFVNPLGSICLNLEKEILKLVKKERKKIYFRFIPLVNLRTVNHLVSLFGIPTNDIQQRNQLFEDTYSAALDYKAAQLQGKKKGRQVLLGLQETVGVKKQKYSRDLAEEFLVAAGGDLDIFRKDRLSNFVKESFQTDQRIAKEMNVTQHPSAVVYDFMEDHNFGICLEGCEALEQVKQLCLTPQEKSHHFEHMLAKHDKKMIRPQHLQLL